GRTNGSSAYSVGSGPLAAGAGVHLDDDRRRRARGRASRETRTTETKAAARALVWLAVAALGCGVARVLLEQRPVRRRRYRQRGRVRRCAARHSLAARTRRACGAERGLAPGAARARGRRVRLYDV